MKASRSSSPRCQSGRPVASTPMRWRAGGVVQADLGLERAARRGDVDRVGQRVERHAHRGRLVEHDLALAVVADQADERGHVAEVLEEGLVLLAAGPRDRAGADAGRVLDALDQEAVAVARRSPAANSSMSAGLRRAPPGLGLLRVGAHRRRARVQAQVLAGGRAADLGAQQQRRGLQRAGGDDDVRRADGDRGGRAGLRVGVDGGDAGGAAALGEDLQREGVDDDLGAVVVRRPAGRCACVEFLAPDWSPKPM